MNNQITTISNMSMKIAAALIVLLIGSLFGIGATYIRDKVDIKDFQEQCRQNDREFVRIQKQLDSYQKINEELIKTLGRMEIKVERTETNTEWIMKELKEVKTSNNRKQ